MAAFSATTTSSHPIVTLTYDCRRTDFFRPHALAALQLVDRGWLSPNARGAAHGEVGQTQFLPANVIRFGVDGDGVTAV